MPITATQLEKLRTRDDLIRACTKNKIAISNYLKNLEYEKELGELQKELVRFQQWVVKRKMRIVVIFEGRDAAGKGGTIKRFLEHLNPRSARAVALTIPTVEEKGQWYFRRYIKELPNAGEIVFFDRSWYNRAVVEPVMGFCTKKQYRQFILQAPEFEHLLYEDDVHVIKFWFSISKKEQNLRFESRKENALKQWKFSHVDVQGQELWDKYTHYVNVMLNKTHTHYCPWAIIHTNNKKEARLESMRYVLSQYDYKEKGKTEALLLPDPNIVFHYNRSMTDINV